MNEDLELINKFKAGQMEGFEMLVRKYRSRLINIANSITGNASDAEDIAQEAFLKIYHNLKVLGIRPSSPAGFTGSP